MMDGGKEYFKDKTIINQIMLRFRPIAPKPVAGGSRAGDPATEDKKAKATNGKSKKKYVRIRKNRCKREKTKKSINDQNKGVVTLQLLPENTATRNETAAKIDPAVPIWLAIDKPVKGHAAACGTSDRAVTVPAVRVVESWVTVECATDTCMEGGIVCTDAERIERLEKDTCPGFVSDSLNRVKWVNQAYKKMVVGPDSAAAAEVVVRLVVKEELPVTCPAFACRVRVQYVQDKQMGSQTMPCDVWRMDLVGLAWRLDVKAALRLGL